MSNPELEPDSKVAAGRCSGLVLAGGAGERMGGQDKGLLPWAGSCLAGHAAGRLAAQGLAVAISANRNLDAYHALGYPLMRDRRAGYAGPLAALEAGLLAGSAEWLLAVPCDSPLFPADLLTQLWTAVASDDGATPRALAAYARCGAERHPVFCLVHRRLAVPLGRFIDDGGHRVSDWWQACGAVGVDFGEAREGEFANANTPEEYARLQARAAGA